MDKIKYVKLELPDGSYSASIPLAVDSDYVNVNGNTLTAELNKKTEKKDIDILQNEINSLVSGSPKGSYLSVIELIAANPETGVYVTQDNGHIYSWTKDAENAIDLGIYQSIEIANNSVSVKNTTFFNKILRNLFDGHYLSYLQIQGSGTNQVLKYNSSYMSTAIIPCQSNTKYTILIKDEGKENDSYYHKIASTYIENLTETLDNILNHATPYDINVWYSDTGTYHKRRVITTNATDNYLIIQTSIAQRPFLQVVEGELEDFTIQNYNENEYGIPNSNIDVYSKEEVDNKIFSFQNTDFFDIIVKNLFNGHYYSGLRLQGNGSNCVLSASGSCNSMAIIPCSTNTRYSILMADPGTETGGYYYQKIAGLETDNLEAIISNVIDNHQSIGINLYQENTRAYKKYFDITTNATDNYLLIQTSLTKQPFLQVVEGELTDFTVNSYDEQEVGIPNEKLDIYSKEEVDNLLQKEDYDFKYKIEKISDTLLYIYYKSNTGYIKYKYYLHTNNTRNLNVWQMGEIYYCDKQLNTIQRISEDGYDQEGVLKLQNEEDYIGGIHGDEQFTEMTLFIDGKPVDILNLDTITTCNEIKFIIGSNVYHANDTTGIPCLFKTKQTTFDENGIHVNNKWTCLEDLNIYHVRAILLSVNKSCISKYYDSNVFTLPMTVPESGGAKSNNKMTDTFYSGDIQAHVWCGPRGGNENDFRSSIVDFSTRLKSYFDCYTGHSAEEGEILYCQNNFKIDY